MCIAKNETPAQRELRRVRTKRYNAKRPAHPRELLYPDMSKSERRKQYMRSWRYGLTIEEWQQLFDAQNNRCACCLSTSPDRNRDWVVDHNHDTGKVRGILCSTCNLAIGLLHDDPVTLERAAGYLRSIPCVDATTRVGIERKRG